MSWWEVVKLVLKYGPTVYAIVAEIIDLIQEIGKGEPDLAQFYSRRLEVAKASVKETKSKISLSQLRDELTRRLDGKQG
jgi:hypothetical protein